LKRQCGHDISAAPAAAVEVLALREVTDMILAVHCNGRTSIFFTDQLKPL